MRGAGCRMRGAIGAGGPGREVAAPAEAVIRPERVSQRVLPGTQRGPCRGMHWDEWLEHERPEASSRASGAGRPRTGRAGSGDPCTGTASREAAR